MEDNKQVWYKPSQIAKEGLIKAPGSDNYHTNYRYIIRLIKSGELKSKVWTQQDVAALDKPKDYYTVHIDEINRFNQQVEV
jgi:hypothetical protein